MIKRSSKSQFVVVLSTLVALGAPAFADPTAPAAGGGAGVAAQTSLSAGDASEARADVKRIVILYSDTGGGHKTAANALAKQIAEKDPTAQVVLKNVWEFSRFQAVAGLKNKIWAKTLHQFPSVRDWGYNRAMEAGNAAPELSDVTQYHLPFDKDAAYAAIAKEHPSAVIATNYSGLEILRVLREQKLLRNVNVGWIATDYAEGYWPRPAQYMDRVFLPHAAMADAFAARGVAREKLAVTGMPVNELVHKPSDRAATLAREGLNPEATTVVITGGSDGAVPYKKIVGDLRDLAEKSGKPVQIVAALGRNEGALGEIRALVGKEGSKVTVLPLGFMPQERLLDLVKASDLYVAKAGGLSTTEGFLLNKPMVVYTAAGGGVEAGNATFFRDQHLAAIADRPENVGKVAWELLNDPARQAQILGAQAAFNRSLNPSALADFALQARPAERKAASVKPLGGLPSAVDMSTNRGVVLDEPEKAFQARLALIKNARGTLDYSTFIFRPDDAGMSQLYLMRDAARRGVKVRLVLDDQGGRKIGTDLLAHLSHEGVEVRIYNKRDFKDLNNFHRRMHDKFVASDNDRMLVGGRNAQDAYFGINVERNRINFDDVEVLLEGRDAAGSRDYFDRLWDGKVVKAPGGIDKVSASALKAAERKLDGYDERHIWQLFGHVRDIDSRMVPLDKFRVVHDTFGLGDLSDGMSKDLYAMFRGAKREITIVSPYFILTPEFIAELEDAKRRGVKVRIITNSMDSNDNMFVSAAYKRDLDKIEHLGHEVWEANGPNMMHSKVYAVDGGEKVYFGSFNVDPRSQVLNTEMGVIIEDADWAKRQAIPFIERSFAKGHPISLNGQRLNPKVTLCNRILKTLVAPQAVHDFF